MPELPEVEVVKQSLEKYILNKKLLKIIVKNKRLRYPVPKNISKELANLKICKIKRISKYVVIGFKNELFLIIHLGMSGTLHLKNCKNNSQNTNLSFYHSKNLPIKHNHVFLNFKNFSIIYNDPRRFGFIKLIIGNINLKNYFSKLGPDPFKRDFNFKYVKKYFYKKNKNIKNTLIDQKFISGIGNIYANEILFFCKINPFRKSSKLSLADYKKLIFYSKSVLKNAIKKGGSSIQNFTNTDGDTGFFQKQFKVYQRENLKCTNKNCSGIIKKKNISNRSTFYCNICQKY